MRKIFFLLMLCSAWGLNALKVVDIYGQAYEYDNEQLSLLTRQDFETIRVRDGVIRKNMWSGFRFDKWMRDKGFVGFTRIRFESSDGYMVRFSSAEMDTLQCWLAFGQDGKDWGKGAMRVIFPQLMEMQWIRDVSTVTLESFAPLGLPDCFLFWESALAEIELHSNPRPFVNIEGWYLDDLLYTSGVDGVTSVIIVSRDGHRISLDWPQHLQGAVLEKDGDVIHMKSPLIPGGMWMRDIVYMQAGRTAFISRKSGSLLLTLDKDLGWNLSPDTTVMLVELSRLQYVSLPEFIQYPLTDSRILHFRVIRPD